MLTPEDERERAFWLQKIDDPEIIARDYMILGWILERRPDLRRKIEEKGMLRQARKMLRSVFSVRGLALGADDEARIVASTVLEEIERWIDQAVVTASAAEALQ